jgi:hypothetical protein
VVLVVLDYLVVLQDHLLYMLGEAVVALLEALEELVVLE